MVHSRICCIAGAISLFLTASPAMAASDYLLKLDGIKGESASSQTVEVMSWSFGASNPTSVGSSGLSAGKAAVQAPRDAASGQATGKRTHEPVRIVKELSPSTPAAAAVAVEPKMGDMGTYTLDLPETPALAASPLVRACASGQHIAQASLSGKGRSVQMSDVVVSSCAVSGGSRQVELKGHVTLIK